MFRNLAPFLIILFLSACSATTSLETPLQPTATAIQTPRLLPSATAVTETLTPLPSATVTLTRTPYPTITYVVQTLEPSATSTDLTGIWRVKHDVERDTWNYQSRLWTPGWIQLHGLPETVRINGGKGEVVLSPAWVEFMDKINSPAAQRYLRREQTGWLNYGPFPKMEQLTFGGNYVYVTRVKGNKAYIRYWSNAITPPNLDIYFFQTPTPTPGPLDLSTLIQNFSVVYTDGSWEMTTPIGDVHTFIIANPSDDPLWIDLSDLTRDPPPQITPETPSSPFGTSNP